MDSQPFTISRVSSFSSELANSIRHLAQQLGNNYQELSDDDLQEMIDSHSHNLFIATIDDEIVGMILVLVYRIPYTRKAYMDDLAVDQAHRGKGIGTALLQHGVQFAQEHGAAYVDFTSHPQRPANKLYEKLGFKKHETNVYRKRF